MRKAVRTSALLALFFGLQLASAAQRRSAALAPPDYPALIERAAGKEVQALENPVPFEYTERLNWSWGSETRSVIETSEGRADRIVLFRDEPLASDQQQKQTRRLEKLLRDHDAVKDELHEQRSETDRRIRMLKALPKALIFDFAGRENGLLRFTFRPNPDFSPKDRETQMYRAMEGELWLEPVQERIVGVEGRLVKDVSFGWGILGKLNKGGIYRIAQTQISPGMWRITTLNVDVKGRILLVESFRVFREESNSHFRRTSPAMSYREAVEALLSTLGPVLGKANH
jgi:hypothetical protein